MTTLELDQVFYENCVTGMQRLPDQFVHLIVTSFPYFNAREYSQWDSEEAYWDEMRLAFTQCFRVLQNHRVLVLNVSDVTCQRGQQKYTASKMALIAQFIVLLKEIGFEYADTIIWDKGEVQSKRNSEPYPFYYNPINCYEGIIIFHKHVADTTKIPCPTCGTIQSQSDGFSEIGVQSWECKNPACIRTEKDRGMRFSARSIMMQQGKMPKNKIPEKLMKKWRRDIVRFPPVIKISSKGENLEEHTAPFPEDIPEFAITMFSYQGNIVLDPFIGSGTTGRVARQYGRRWIGFEIHNEFKPRIDHKTLRTLGKLDTFFK